MTGLELWVLAGIELGAGIILDAAEGLDLNHPDTPKEIATRIMKRWPPWKVDAQRQQDLALEPQDGRPYIDREQLDQAPAGRKADLTCARCKGLTTRLSGTPYGPLCNRCLTLYIDRKWPENP